MAISTVPKIFRDGTLKLEDATGGTPLSVTVSYTDGDFEVSEFSEAHMSVVEFKDRGIPYNLRKTERDNIAFSFSAHFTDLSDATERTLLDIVCKQNSFSAGVSVLGANADVWALKLTWTVEGTNYGDAADHVLTLAKCRVRAAISEGTPNKFSIKGVAYVYTTADVSMT